MHQAKNISTKSMREHHAASKRSRQRGFTFIEIMIAVTIVAILTALALPSYGNYVRQARRADGHLVMLTVAQTMERCRSTNWTYVGCTVATASEEGHYTVSMGTPTATTYTITATAAGAQANDSVCSPMTLNHLGDKTPANCWRD